MTPQINLVEVSDRDFDWMLGLAARHDNLRLPPGGIDDPAVLHIVRAMTRLLHVAGCRGSWMMIRDAEVVGLCSYKRPPENGTVEIGYGTAPQRRNAGIATAGVGAMLDIASGDSSITVVTAETALSNRPSQRVLEKNGFIETSRRIDREDGEVICWRRSVAER